MISTSGMEMSVVSGVVAKNLLPASRLLDVRAVLQYCEFKVVRGVQVLKPAMNRDGGRKVEAGGDDLDTETVEPGEVGCGGILDDTHDFSISGSKGGLKTGQQVAVVNGAKGLGMVLQARDGGKGTGFAGAGRHPADKFDGQQGQVDRQKKIQVGVAGRESSFYSGKRAGARVVVFNDGSKDRKIWATSGDAR